MKRPVSWHEECLTNMRQSLDGERAKLEVLRLHVHRLMDDVSLAERQIAEAKRRGMEGFDRERLLIKRTK